MKKLSAVLMALVLCVSVSFAARGGTSSSSGSSSKSTSSKSSSSSSGDFGIGYSRLGARVVNVSLDQIAVRYWISEEIGVDAGLGFSSGDAEAAVLFTGKFLYSFINRDKVKFYLLAGLGFGNYENKQAWNSQSQSLFIVEGGVGIEYFVIPCLSVLTEIGLRYGSVSANGNSASQFNTFGDWIPEAGVRFYF